jgi:tetratricopeptide (TPR) repeat protein
MKKSILLTITTFCLIACNYKPSDEALVTYVKAKTLYSEGKLAETASMLDSEKRFPPALMLRGKAEYFTDKNDKALKTFKRALMMRPSSTEASLYMVRILQEEGRTEEARSLIKDMLSDDPYNVRSLRLAATISDNDEAAAFLDRAVEASSETVLVLLDRARLKWISGNSKTALEDLRRAEILVNDDSPISKSIRHLEAAIREESNK